MPSIIVYEDPGWQRLLPLVYVRAVFQLICGTVDLLSRIRLLAASDPVLWCRPSLQELLSEQTGLVVNPVASGSTLLLNGRGLWKRLPTTLESERSWVGIVGSDDIACIHADADLASQLSAQDVLDEARLKGLLGGVPRRDVGECVQLMDWPWDFVLANEAQLRADWDSDPQPRIHGSVRDGA